MSKRAVIIEPRNHPLLIPILLVYLSHLPNDWKITIFHGNKNKDVILNSPVMYDIQCGRAKMMNLHKDNLTIDEYNQMLLLPEFWKQFKESRILLFEIDTILCSNSPYKIDEFLQYDYIGAPWDKYRYEIMKKNYASLIDDGKMSQVGNSGLSICNPKVIVEVLEKYGDKKREVGGSNRTVMNADVFFAIFLPKIGANIAPFNIAKKFSSETILDVDCFGAHKTVKYHSQKKLREFHIKCPESLLLYAYDKKFDKID